MTDVDEEDTETKLALLASVFPNDISQEELLDVLIKADGDVERAIASRLTNSAKRSPSPAPSEPPPQKRLKTQDVRESEAAVSDVPVKSLGSILKWTSIAEPSRKVLSLASPANIGTTPNSAFI